MNRAMKLVGILMSLFMVANVAVAGGYSRSYYGHHRSSGHHGHWGGDVPLALGLGLLFGTALGHHLSESRHHHYEYYGSSTVYRSPRYVRRYYEYERPVAVYREVVRSPQAVQPTSRCLQEREYQTTVIVGGQEVEAYGTACLQPDGAWLRGPAKLADY